MQQHDELVTLAGVIDIEGPPVVRERTYRAHLRMVGGADGYVGLVSSIRVARIYDDPSPCDGLRVLVDRLWPRGISNERAALDEWCKEVGPSHELRRWYAHDPERFDEFTARYLDELATGPQASSVAHLRELAASGTVTLLTATKRAEISEAAVLADLLRGDSANA